MARFPSWLFCVSAPGVEPRTTTLETTHHALGLRWVGDVTKSQGHRVTRGGGDVTNVTEGV